MYTLVTAYCKNRDGNREWNTVDIGGIQLNNLFLKYSRIIAILSNPFITGNVAVDLETLTPSSEGLFLTFNQFLVANGNNTLVKMDHIPTFSTKYAGFADAFHAGYKVDPIGKTQSYTMNMLTADKTYLRLTKPGVDYSLFHSSCLVNVNGFFHMIDSDINGAYVVDGMKTARKANQNMISVYSFKDLGHLQYIPITAQMLYKQIPEQAYKNSVYINTGVDLTNKTVLLVIGGYLHILDEAAFRQVSNTSIRVDVGNLPILDRYFESKDYIDLSSLNLSSTPRNPNQIAISDLFSDTALAAYFTLSQSFIVLLDNPDVFIEQDYVKPNVAKDMYIAYTSPEYPLVTTNGKVSNYHYRKEGTIFSISTRDSMEKNYLYDTIDPKVVNSVDNTLLGDKPYSFPKAYLMKVGSSILV